MITRNYSRRHAALRHDTSRNHPNQHEVTPPHGGLRHPNAHDLYNRMMHGAKLHGKEKLKSSDGGKSEKQGGCMNAYIMRLLK